MSEIVELPRLIGCASASDRILVDEDFYRSEVSGKVFGILVRLCQFRWRDPGVVPGRFRRTVSKPFLQLEQAERLLRVVELRGDGGSGSVACNAATRVINGTAALLHSSGMMTLLM